MVEIPGPRRRYNPRLEDFEWRKLGAGVMVVLVRAGDAARKQHESYSPEPDPRSSSAGR